MQTTHDILFGSARNMSAIEAETIELVVTSPPYPMISMWDLLFALQTPDIKVALENGNGYKAFEAMHSILDEVWRECSRVLIPGGFLCINIGDATRKIGAHFRLFTNHARIISSCEALGFHSLPPLLWRKQTNSPTKFMGSGMLPAGAYVTLEHEYILVFRKGGNRRFSEDGRMIRKRSALFWEERNSWFSDLWDFKGIRQPLSQKGCRSRSAAFPFELAFRLINMYSIQNDTVLDPFLGTGTVTAAAIASARNSVGIEIDTGLCGLIKETITAATEAGNKRQSKRLSDHLHFVEGKELKHCNSFYSFPVVTTQETALRLPRSVTTEQTPSSSPSRLRYCSDHDFYEASGL